MRIGVLSLQGAFQEHLQALADLSDLSPFGALRTGSLGRRLRVEAVAVRLPRQLRELAGLIIPGGESTTIGKLATLYNLLPAIEDMARNGLPIWGTCAGLILLAREIVGYQEQPRLRLLDVTVRRNAFGRQVDSFQTLLSLPVLDEVATPAEHSRPFPAVFIRAPVIEKVGAGVTVLATLADGSVVAVQQGQLLATSFHPELTSDRRFHRYFLSLAADRQQWA